MRRCIFAGGTLRERFGCSTSLPLPLDDLEVAGGVNCVAASAYLGARGGVGGGGGGGGVQ